MSLSHRTKIGSLTIKKQTAKFSSADFKKMVSPSYVILRIQKLSRANSLDLDEVTHNESPHQDLHSLQIQLFLSVVLKELRSNFQKEIYFTRAKIIY